MNQYDDVEKYQNFFKVCERVNNHPDFDYKETAKKVAKKITMKKVKKTDQRRYRMSE